MEIAPLKSFATWARTALIREVSARISVVLASQELRQEQPKAVAALEKAINAADGGDKGRDAVADKVAYTWFNRIIALRFMDANGYTGIGVVSPERGREGGQPEILAETKRGNIDSAVVTNKRTVETVTSLLNGTRRSDDPQGEAYALLLAEYCRHWNGSMPFMFEREGDYTELLIPANLLADDSVLARAVSVLTEEVCQDVEVIGWLYQFYISERKDEVFAGFKTNKKAGAAEIPAATQLFTPHWIVRYLVENSLGRLWLLNRPTSRLADQMDYYIAPVDAETDYLKVSSPEELKVIDPACGSAHMLTYAFDLLYAIYEEEGYAPADIPGLILANNLYGTEIDPRAGALAAFALTMKARARQRTFFNKQGESNICVLEPISFTPTELDTLVTPGGDRADEKAFWNQFQRADSLGALIRPREELIEPLRRHLDTHEAIEADLIGGSLFERARRVIVQAEYLSSRYHVVVANPPYMGSGNMDARLAQYAKNEFPATKSDLFAMFIERSFEMVLARGYSAMITMESWMFLRSYSRLREEIVTRKAILSMVHMPYLGKGGTSMGISFGTAATVILNSDFPGLDATFQCVRYFETDALGRPLSFPVTNERYTSVPSGTFSAIQDMPIAYWLSDKFRGAFENPPLGASVAVKKGLDTGSNARFLRLWHEVSGDSFETGCADAASSLSSDRRWYPLNKGGERRRWYGNQDYVIDWQHDGAAIRANVGVGERGNATIRNPDYFFSKSVGWTMVTSAEFSARYYPPGFIFGSGGGGIFTSHDSLLGVLGLLNSAVMLRGVTELSPTLNFDPGPLSRFPLAPGLPQSGVVEVARRLVELHKRDWDRSETSWSFTTPEVLELREAFSLREQVAQVAARWHETVNEVLELERGNNERALALYGIEDEIDAGVDLDSVTLSVLPQEAKPYFDDIHAYAASMANPVVENLVSYAVGCMFGRYSLDEPGLILANQGDTLQDYLAKVPSPTFRPDKDNVIPIVDGDWFEDDIVGRFRQFLRVAFGEEHFEENLRFVTDSLGVKNLRHYFVKSFYKDHLQRYKKRPIYWLFSSPQGSFTALIYVHRYTPSIVSTVLNEYLREFKSKLEASRLHHERLAAGSGTPREKVAAQKEVDRLRKMLLELDEYEHDVLYPLATQQVQIDLDDGVKANYPKFGAALKKIPGLEANDE